MWFLLISIGLEYIFLIVNIVWIIRSFLSTRKQKQEQSKVKVLNKKNSENLIYKWVKKRAYEGNPNVINLDPFAKIEDTLDKKKGSKRRITDKARKKSTGEEQPAGKKVAKQGLGPGELSPDKEPKKVSKLGGL